MQSPTSHIPSTQNLSEAARTPRARTGERWVFSLTAVCFLFGGLLALQMRAVQSAEKNRVANAQSRQQLEEKQARDRAESEKAQRTMKSQLAALKDQLKAGKTVSEKNAKLLGGQIKNLEMISGLTPVSGPGVRIYMDDNKAVAGGDVSGFAPGLVHDFDLLQVVNELRAASAEAISVKGKGQSEGTRITAYTPIRCVGPVIHVNWQPVAAPFIIEALGEPGTLESALTMSGGILANLKDPSRGPALDIRVSKQDNLTLPAATGGAPRLKVSKPQTAAP